MRKGFKVLSLILGIVLLLGIVGVGIASAADPTPTTRTDYRTALLSRVASILGIDEQRLTNAFLQAQREIENEMIDQAVAEGRITQEWANWLKQRPQQDDFRFGFGFFGFKGGRMHGKFGWPGKIAPAPTPTQ